MAGARETISTERDGRPVDASLVAPGAERAASPLDGE